MSDTSWKPGAVAMVHCSDGEWRQATCEPHAIDPARVVWRFPNRVYRDVDTSTARPLVVIDPENREQVVGMCRRYVETYSGPGTSFDPDGANRRAVECMQAALRSLIDPPKLEEPTGLGAVVTDVAGTRWIITGGPTQPGFEWYSPDLNSRTSWDLISAVKVLNEGVTA